jgi:hypothetical protein
MPVYHRTQRLQINGEKPEVTKLHNDRYQITVRCVAKDDTRAWYYGNKDQIFSEFGTLYSSQMLVDGIDPRQMEAYPDMTLVSNQATYTHTGEYVIDFIYETLTETFVEEKASKVDYNLNGLKRQSKTIIAINSASYDLVVGTSVSNGLTLASVEEYQLKESEGGFKRIMEVWMEEGTLSQTKDLVGSQGSIVIETIGADPNAPDGYSLASKQESEYQGLQANRFTFLKDDVELSRSDDLVGSQKAIVIEQFNGTPATPSGYALANTQVSDIGGIPTKRYTFLKSNVTLSQSEDLVGSQLAIVIEQFDGVPGTPTGYSIANKQESDVDGIKTNRYTFLKDNVELSRSEDFVGSQKSIAIEQFNGTPTTPSGYSLANEQVSEIGGIPTRRYTFLKPSVLSRTEDKVGSQVAIVVEAFSETPLTPSGYELANTQESDIEGIPTRRYTFLKSDVTLSQSEDLVGSQKAIVIEQFNGTPVAPTGYALASTQVSEVEGIPTRRYTFLKDNVTLSQSEELVGSQLSITIEQFNGTPATPSGYAIASKQRSDVDGIETTRYTFLKSNTILSETEDLVGSQKAIVLEVFNGTPTTPGGYSIANTQVSDVGGIPTKRYTFLKDDVKLGESEDKVGSQLAASQQWFNPAADKTLSGYSLASKNTSDFEGIETVELRFLKDNVELSRSEDKVGSQLSITTEVFNPTANPAESGYSVARTEVSDVEGIPTKRFTFLKDNVKLSESEDNVGSQLAKVQEWFNPTTEPSIADYVIASVQKSDVEGIETERYTFLKSDTTLSQSEDLVGSQKAIVIEQFDGVPATPSGYILANTQVSDVQGIPTNRYTFLKEDVQLSESEDRIRSQLAVSQQWFNPAADKTLTDYSLASKNTSDFQGIKTVEFRFLKNGVELSRSEDLVGSQLAITTEVFNPVADPVETDYSLARTEVSDVDGVPTKRYTFLKSNVKLSESEDKVGSQLAKVEEWFNPESEPSITDYVIASVQRSDAAGIPTERYTFLKEGVKLSESEDKIGSQNAITEEWFKPSVARKTKSLYSLARTEASDIGGIPTERYTFLKNNVELSKSEDKVGSQLSITTEVFKPTGDPIMVGYSIARKDASEVDGIPTERFTLLKDGAILSVSQDRVSSQLAVTNEVFNPAVEAFTGFDISGVALSGYSEASRQKSDVEGIPTIRYTFLKDNVELSRSEDYVGSQLSITTEVFNPTSDPSELGYSVARTQVSDVGGIPTKRFTFLKDDAELSRSEDLVGSQLAIVTEVFNPTSDPTEVGYVVANTQESDIDGIPTKRYTFLKDDVELSRSEDYVGSQLSITTEVFKPSTTPLITDYSLSRSEVSDVAGIPTKRFTFLKNNVTLSVSEDRVGSQLSVVNEVFNPTTDSITGVDVIGAALVDYSEANRQKSDFNGIPTIRYTFLKNNVQLSLSEDKVGSQLAIIEKWFKPEASRGSKTDYSLAREEVSDVDGIPTVKYTFLKNDVELSRSEDLAGSQLSIITEVFNPTADPVETDYSIARTDVSEVDGISTKRYTFLKNNATLSVSQDNIGSQLAVTNEVFNPDLESITGVDINGVALVDYSEANRQKSDFNGIPTIRYTFLKDDAELSRSEDLVGSQLSIITEVFNPTIDPVEEDYSIARKDISDVDGIPTVRYAFLKDGAILSVSQDNAEGQLTIINEVFNPETESITGVDVSGVALSGYSEASRQKSDFDGIPTFRYTFIKAGLISTKQDSGPQGLPNTKTRQYVSLISEPVNPAGIYNGILLSKSIDNLGGLPVYTYTYLEGDEAGSSPTGEGTLLQSYGKYIEVRKAGELSAATVTAPSGASGSTAVLSVIPPSIKKVQATIKVDLFTSAIEPTLSATPAFNLSDVSASASITTTRRSPVGVEQGTNLSVSVFNVRVNSETRSYPNHFFSAPGSVSGSITSPAHIVRDDDSIIGEALDETTSTDINFTGSSTEPAETGIYQQDIEPVFIDANGNQYYRKTTYTI